MSGGSGARVRGAGAGAVVVAVVLLVVLGGGGGGGAVVVVVVGADVVVVGPVVVVVVSGTARLRMSCENAKAACRPAAAPIPGGSVASACGSAVSAAAGAPSSASSLLGEKAANAAMASSAITTQVAKARSRVNLTPVNFRVLNKRPTLRQHAWNRMDPRHDLGGKPSRENQVSRWFSRRRAGPAPLPSLR